MGIFQVFKILYSIDHSIVSFWISLGSFNFSLNFVRELCFASFIISDIIPKEKPLTEESFCFTVIRMVLLGEFRTILKKEKRQDFCNYNV